MSAPEGSDPSWPTERGISRGTVALLGHAIVQILALPFRVLWAVVTSGRQRRRIRRCIDETTDTTPR